MFPFRAPPASRLSGYYFCYFAFIGAFSPYFGLYLQGLGFSAWEIAMLLSQMQLMRVVAPNVWGWISDRSGHRVAIVRLAAFLSLLGFVPLFFVETFVAWMVAMAVLAFFWGAALPLVEAITLDHLAGDSSRYSRIRLWGSIGFIVAVLATGWTLDRVPLPVLLPILAACLACILGFALLLPDGADGRHHPPGSLGDTLRQRRVWTLLLACFAMSAAHGALYVFYSIHIAAVGYSRSVVGALWSLGVVAEIGVFMVMARVMRRHSIRSILLVCFVAATLRFLMIGWGAENLLILIVAQVLHGLTFGAHHAAAIAAINAWFPRACQGRGQALYSSVSFGAGGLLGGVLAGAMWEPWGGAVTFTASAGMALLGAAVVIYGGVAERGRVEPAR